MSSDAMLPPRLRPIIRVTATLAAALALSLTAACASSEPSAPVLDRGQVIVAQAGADVTLATGQSAQIPSANVQVTFKRLVSDSRCPTAAHIQCVWGGSAIVDVEGTPIVGFAYVETRRLESLADKDTATVAGQPVRLVRVLPERTSMDSISTAAYRIVLRVGATK